MPKNIIKDLIKRKLIKQISNKSIFLKNIKNNKIINIYCGFDPTYKSLHIGHLLLIITLLRFKIKKFNITIILGTITAQIGEYTSHIKYKKNKIKQFTKIIKKQIKNIFQNYKKKYKINFIDNKKWFKKTKLIDFLKKIGNYFNINEILNKEHIKSKINKNKNITFKNITYILLQSYDYYWLYKNKKTNLQIGGSDQWGNIISGINLIKKKYNKNAFGFTLPLITDNLGNKLSKSSKNKQNIIWLNKKLTSIYEFYQFWLNIKDNLTSLYLKQFTFLKTKKIKILCKKNNININKQILAKYITSIVHGKKNTQKAIFATKCYFNNIKKITLKKFNLLNKINLPKITINYKNNINIKKILILLKISNSNNQSINLIKNKSIYLNQININNINYLINNNDKLFNKYSIISKGKKNFYLINWK